MKTTAGYKRSIAEIRSLWSRHKYAEALAAVDSLLAQWPDQPALLVLRAELIQLQDENGPALDEAAAALKRVVALDDANADAWLELGHFELSVEDDSKAAEKSFTQAIDASSATLIAALIGRAAALEELGRKGEAFDCLSAARYLQDATATKKSATGNKSGLLERWESLVGSA